MIALVLPFVLAVAAAAPHNGALYAGVVGPAFAKPSNALSYTLTNVNTGNGGIQQQAEVTKDALGGHTIRHSAQASSVDPHTGQTDVKHDQHEFHINPYMGQAAVHTNNAAGSLNPTIGKASFAQKTHEAQIAPGHASVADVADTAAVSSHSSAASRDVNAARTDVLHDGVAKNAHASHKSYVNTPVGAQSQVAETNHRSFDGEGYGSLHYDSQAADEAYDVHGHSAANEAGYKLDQAYDARVNLGASNELQYSRHASHDPYGNYGAVTQTRQASQGGQLVPVVKEVAPVVYAAQPAAVYPGEAVAVYGQPAYQKQTTYIEEAPVAYQKQATLIYNEPVAVSYQKQASLAAYEPVAVYKQPVAYGYGHQKSYYHGY